MVSAMSDEPEVRRIGVYLPISREMALDHGLVEPTDAERRRAEAEHQAQDVRRRAATAAWPVFVAALDAVTDPVARAVLDLHKIDPDGACRGCDFTGYEAEPPGWPCTTIHTVAAAVGIDDPGELWLADQARL